MKKQRGLVVIYDPHALMQFLQFYCMDNHRDIEWDVLPSRFALKLNYACGYNIICKDKSKLDKTEAVAKLKSTSPKAKGSKKHYASGWTYTKVNVRRGQFSSQIYNKTKPGLAHLLEHKHEIIGPDGESHGWSTPQPHIAEVNNWVQAEIVKRITQNLQK